MNARCPQVTSIQITKHSGRFPIVFIARLFIRLCMVSVCFISLRIIWFLQQASITRNFASKSELVLSQVFRDLPSSRCTTWADYSKWTGANGFERSSGTEKLIVAKTFIFFFFLRSAAKKYTNIACRMCGTIILKDVQPVIWFFFCVIVWAKLLRSCGVWARNLLEFCAARGRRLF